MNQFKIKDLMISVQPQFNTGKLNTANNEMQCAAGDDCNTKTCGGTSSPEPACNSKTCGGTSAPAPRPTPCHAKTCGGTSTAALQNLNVNNGSWQKDEASHAKSLLNLKQALAGMQLRS